VDPGSWPARLQGVARAAVSVGFWVVAVTAWVAPVIAWLQWSSGAHVTFGFGLTRDIGLRLSGQLPAGAELTVLPATAALDVPHLSGWLHALTLFPETVVGLATGVGFLLARGIVLSVLDGRPFDAVNPRRFARLAAVVLVGGLAHVPVRDAISERVLRELTVSGTPVPVVVIGGQLDAFVAMAGALLLLAWSFRRGLQVSRDVEGLV